MKFLNSALFGSALAQLYIDPMMDSAPEFREEDMQKIVGRSPPTNSTANDGPTIMNPTLCDDSVKQYAGHIPFTGFGGSDKNFFFWLFESRNNPKEDPLVLWLTGGPGCSSMMALLMENGPCIVGKDGKAVKNPHSWNNKANVIWLDQPAGTGFSEGQWVTGEEGVQEDAYAFLLAFYKALPQFKNNKFYITGESYAGHYVPSIAHRVWKGNLNKEGDHINLAGVAIGNGLTDSSEQYKWYPEMAEDGGKNEGGTLENGVISGLTLKFMKAAVGPCIKMVEKCNGPEADFTACQSALMVCNFGLMVPYMLSGMNMYDMRIKCEKPPLCYDFSHLDAFLNAPDTQKQLGVDATWQECNQMVNKAFMGDFMKNFHSQLPDLLHSGIKVVVYAGDVDYICNWLGNKAWTLLLEWNGKEEFNGAEDQDFILENKKVGRVRVAAEKFAFVQVYQAGHMVPMDQPAVAAEILTQLIKERPMFEDLPRGPTKVPLLAAEPEVIFS